MPLHCRRASCSEDDRRARQSRQHREIAQQSRAAAAGRVHRVRGGQGLGHGGKSRHRRLASRKPARFRAEHGLSSHQPTWIRENPLRARSRAVDGRTHRRSLNWPSKTNACSIGWQNYLRHSKAPTSTSLRMPVASPICRLRSTACEASSSKSGVRWTPGCRRRLLAWKRSLRLRTTRPATELSNAKGR